MIICQLGEDEVIICQLGEDEVIICQLGDMQIRGWCSGVPAVESRCVPYLISRLAVLHESEFVLPLQGVPVNMRKIHLKSSQEMKCEFTFFFSFF